MARNKGHQCRVDNIRRSTGMFHVVCPTCKDIGGSKKRILAVALAVAHARAFGRAK